MKYDPYNNTNEAPENTYINYGLDQQVVAITKDDSMLMSHNFDLD